MRFRPELRGDALVPFCVSISHLFSCRMSYSLHPHLSLSFSLSLSRSLFVSLSLLYYILTC